MKNYPRNCPKSKSNMEIKVLAQHMNLSVSKARRVIDMIRGCNYNQTIKILRLAPYKACYPIRNLIISAVSNAHYNMGLDEADSYIDKAQVNRGTIVKKFRPRAKGHSYPIKRTTCHIIIVFKKNKYLEE